MVLTLPSYLLPFLVMVVCRTLARQAIDSARIIK
jgi:hypothetical protein